MIQTIQSLFFCYGTNIDHMWYLSLNWSSLMIQIVLGIPTGMTSTARLILWLAFWLRLALRWKTYIHQFYILQEGFYAQNFWHSPVDIEDLTWVSEIFKENRLEDSRWLPLSWVYSCLRDDLSRSNPTSLKELLSISKKAKSIRDVVVSIICVYTQKQNQTCTSISFMYPSSKPDSWTAFKYEAIR